MIYTAQLENTTNRLTHQQDWYVLTDHPGATQLELVSGYWPSQGGDSSLEECETWLKNRGFAPDGEMPPQCFEYSTN